MDVGWRDVVMNGCREGALKVEGMFGGRMKGQKDLGEKQ